jgi:hypothetical protein
MVQKAPWSTEGELVGGGEWAQYGGGGMEWSGVEWSGVEWSEGRRRRRIAEGRNQGERRWWDKGER